MKARFSFFDEVALDLSIDDAPGPQVTAAFLRFLRRPLHPHVTVFGEPRPGSSALTPHFTAGGGRFRRRLAEVRPEAIGGALDRLGAVVMNRMAASVRRADFSELHEGGWTVHGPDFRVLARWLRRAAHRSEFRIDPRLYLTLGRHIVRRCFSPMDLVAWQPPELVRLVLLHVDRISEPQGRTLTFAPHGYWVERPGEEPICVHEPGWYVQAFDWLEPDAYEHVLPGPRIRTVGDRVKRLLKRFPRRSASSADAELAELEPLLRQIVDFYTPELLHLAVAARLARARLLGAGALADDPPGIHDVAATSD